MNAVSSFPGPALCFSFDIISTFFHSFLFFILSFLSPSPSSSHSPLFSSFHHSCPSSKPSRNQIPANGTTYPGTTFTRTGTRTRDDTNINNNRKKIPRHKDTRGNHPHSRTHCVLRVTRFRLIRRPPAGIRLLCQQLRLGIVFKGRTTRTTGPVAAAYQMDMHRQLQIPLHALHHR